MEVKLPEIGEGVESGDVLEVYVSEGDTIEKDQDILEIETDKATLGVPSDQSGRVSKVHVAKGDAVTVGQVLITIDAGDGSAPSSAATEQAAVAQEEPASVEEEPVEQPAAPVASEPSEPATPEPPRQPAPKPPQPMPQPVQVATINDHYDESDAAIPAGPAIRRFAREVGVDLQGVKGTGENGRITRDDVLSVVRSSSRSAPAAPASSGRAAPSAPVESLPSPTTGNADKWGPIRTEKLTRIRKTIANKMHESWETCPRVTNFDDADVTALEKIRQASKADYAAAGIKLTAMPFLIKAVAMSLRGNPTINASLDMESEQIIFKEYVNIGIAVDSERGLVVPSLRDAADKSISDLARDLADLAVSVREGSFKVEDLQGSTFTISNLGAIGGNYSTPIINVPEVAILLVGRSRKMPVVIDDKIEIRLMMPLSLSYDHRLVDGATAARFLNDVKAYLEEPSRLLLAP